MDHDTLNSIAVKFETTPAELARLNKKPLGPTSTVFTGEVKVDNVILVSSNESATLSEIYVFSQRNIICDSSSISTHLCLDVLQCYSFGFN